MIKESYQYDDKEDRLIVKTTYDNTATLEANKADRNAFAGYKGDMVHVGRIDEGDVVRLKNLGYNLLSPDMDEWRRALLYIQQHEPHLLTVPGKPIAKKRISWQ